MKETGVLELKIFEKNGRSVPSKIFYTGALKVMRPQYLGKGQQLCYMILNPGGGFVDGDFYKIKVHLESNTDVYLTTQSATKIYETPKIGVVQSFEVELEADSHLAYLPDSIIPYESSNYRQYQKIKMDTTASLFFSEIITPGWSTDGEGFQFSELFLSNEIYMQEELVVLDRLIFLPTTQEMSSIGLWQNYERVGTLLAIHPLCTLEWLEGLKSELSDYFSEAKIDWGISTLSVPGVAIRCLGDSTQSLEEYIAFCYEYFRRTLLMRETHLVKKY